MRPYLVTPAEHLPVQSSDMRAHLRIDGGDEDALIESLQAGAVALLDGWGGSLGRCILPQTWAIDVTGYGPHLLPFPDAYEIVALAGDDELQLTAKSGALGVEVIVHDAPSGEVVTITAKYALPEQQLPAAEVLIKLIVGNWFENREAVVIGTISSELPMAANALISALRWFRA